MWTQDKSWPDSQLEYFKKKYNLNVITSNSNMGLSTDPTVIHQGSNSGYQAINLAYHMNPTKIILIGYDMQFTNGKAHWFGEHPDKVRSSYHAWMIMYASLAEHAKKLGLEIINATTETALTCFPRDKLENIL